MPSSGVREAAQIASPLPRWASPKRKLRPRFNIGWPPLCCQLKCMKLCRDGYFLFGAPTVQD